MTIQPSTDRRFVLLGLAGILVAGVALLVWVWHAPAREVGTTHRVELAWQSCSRTAAWIDPDTSDVWLATTPVDAGRRSIETEAPDADATSTRHARGSVHIDTRDAATFTSDAGGTLAMERQPTGRFSVTSCVRES